MSRKKGMVTKMECFIGLDIGTSAVKGILLSAAGETLAAASGNFEYYGEKGAHLLKPERFLEVCFSVIRELAEAAGDRRIAAVCPCCASGNLIFLGEAYEPLTPIIGWQSTVDEAEFLSLYTDREREEIYRTVGWPAVNGFPVTYFPWIAKNKKELLSRAKMICMSAEYLNFALTGRFGISPSMGTPFYLLDQEKGCYAEALLRRFGVREEQLPPIFDKGTVLGTVTKDAADALGVPGMNPGIHSAGTAVVLGSFDHPSCATGAGVYGCDEVLLSCGTSWVEFFPVESRRKAIETGFLVDRYMTEGAPYCVMSSIASLSRRISALRTHYLGRISHAELDSLAVQSEKGCGGLRFDFTDGDFMRAGNFEKRHIARAIYESAAMLLKENFKEAEAKGLRTDKVTMAGGITNSAVCMKIIAETLGQDVKVVGGASAGAIGAAMLAGIGVKAFKNEEDAFGRMKFTETVYTC